MSNNPSKDSYDSIQHFVRSDLIVSQLYNLDQVYHWMNCITDIDLKKETVGTTSPIYIKNRRKNSYTEPNSHELYSRNLHNAPYKHK